MSATETQERRVAESRSDGLQLLTDDGDEWTVAPIDADGYDRLSRWITVDRDTLCDLEAWR